MSEILRRFDGWETVSDLPKGTAAKSERLFKAINAASRRVMIEQLREVRFGFVDVDGQDGALLRLNSIRLVV